VAEDADGLTAVTSLLSRFDTPGESIAFSWAFPRYGAFDPDVLYSNTALGDTFPGGRVMMFGDLRNSASNVEKRVGFTFSDPAVGTVTTDRSITAVMTGSGYFPDVEDNLPGRGASAPDAGHAFFLLNAATGLPIGNAGGSSCNGTGCYDVGDVSNGRKNAIQADVTASGNSGDTVVSQAYVGDVDGKYWRFTFDSTGSISATSLVNTQQPIFSSSALLFVGTAEKYLFFGTGSDLLPNVAPGGGSATGTAFKLWGIKDGASAGTVTFSRDLAPVYSSTGNCRTNGERPTSSPTVAGDIVFFTATTGSTIQPCVDATSQLYAFTYLGTAAYDSDGNGTLNTNESPVVATIPGRATAPFIVDQHLFIGTSSSLGPGVTMVGDTEDFNNGVGQVGVRILSWREIR
jgi:Tfp pilus tip-associated adhesin PilY1